MRDASASVVEAHITLFRVEDRTNGRQLCDADRRFAAGTAPQAVVRHCRHASAGNLPRCTVAVHALL